MYCNGARLTEKFMEEVVDAGIDFIRISVIGYNRDLYKKWMNIDNFELILKNLSELKTYRNFKCSNKSKHISFNY